MKIVFNFFIKYIKHISNRNILDMGFFFLEIESRSEYAKRNTPGVYLKKSSVLVGGGGVKLGHKIFQRWMVEYI